MAKLDVFVKKQKKLGRNCSGEDFCCFKELSSGWKQRDDCYWAHEHCWFLYFLLCYNRYVVHVHVHEQPTFFINIYCDKLYTCDRSGAFSRSAVNHNAGSKTAVSNIVMAVTVMVTLLFLMPLFQYTPNVVLGAIIVTAVIGLIDIPAALRIWKIDKFDFLVLLCAFFGVIFISVQDGLAIAVSFIHSFFLSFIS